jgi:hypothetical protein
VAQAAATATQHEFIHKNHEKVKAPKTICLNKLIINRDFMLVLFQVLYGCSSLSLLNYISL